MKSFTDMKQILIFLLLIAAGCSQRTHSEKQIVTVTILPQKFFVEKIAGDLVEVNVLVPPGASPELYSPMPSQMKELAGSLGWFRIGKMGFEESWINKIRQSTPTLKIFDTSVQADWIAGETEQHGDHVHLHGIDPHIWVAPDEVKKIVTETYKALLNLFPGKEEELTANYDLFLNEIEQLDAELKHKFDRLENRKFLIFHPALAYLARQYQLEQVSLEVEGKEPSPGHLRSLIDLARAENIRVVFIQKESNAENARQLAREIGGEVIQIDPLSEQWDDQLRDLADKIVAASAK
ncbi:metal ABC transporter solute-binding protein, Zn/Mn family [Gaoshiqia sp. Z1-71]|uniref:metal ABC transporter solute-binding protein, Zn/Mn family n=1 Tax=Gaoshiqia hydrogeniformans TaxID=3290090 RepID=UPI003BF8AE52